MKLDRLEELLAQQIVHRFPDRAYLRKVESVPKGTDVLMECADLIASAVRRRVLYDTTHAKDLVSAAVMKETGLESFARTRGRSSRFTALEPEGISQPRLPPTRLETSSAP